MSDLRERMELWELVAISLVLGLLIIFGEGCGSQPLVTHEFEGVAVDPTLAVVASDDGGVDVTGGFIVEVRQLINGLDAGFDIEWQHPDYLRVSQPHAMGLTFELWWNKCYWRALWAGALVYDGEC